MPTNNKIDRCAAQIEAKSAARPGNCDVLTCFKLPNQAFLIAKDTGIDTYSI